MAPQVLENARVRSFLAAHAHWDLDQGELVRNTDFKDFKQAMAFINQVAELAENAGHHPDIDIRYNKVRLALVTHDAGGITQNDINLAMEIDSILEK